MRSAQSLDRMNRLVPEVAAEDLFRYREIVALLEAAPKRVPAAWLPNWNRAMYVAKKDLRAILAHCCRAHHGEEIARELLARIPDDDDPVD
ncbi:MAG TPA: hypothetical protein VGF40_13475 [Thermoanaerobaculia bacterium]